MKNIFLFIGTLVLCYSIQAQKKELTYKETIYYNPEILPKSLQNIAWKGESDMFTFLYNDKLVLQHNDGKTTDTVLDLQTLNQSLIAAYKDTLSYFPYIKWLDEESFYFEKDNKYYTYSMSNKLVSKKNSLSEEAENIDLNTTNFAAAYTKANNLYIAMDGKETAVSNESNPGIVFGKEVHRREFGIEKGTFWSPSGNYLAFYRKDETMVSDYPLVNIDTRIATLKPDKYPMAGMTSHEVTLGVYNIKSGKTVYMKTGTPKDQYLTVVTWDPSEKYIYIGLLNRDQNHLKLNKYDAMTGAFVATLFEEKDEKYVEPELPLYFLKDKPDQFLWLSERNGYNNLYLYNTEGYLIKNITNPNLIVTDIYGYNSKENTLYFGAIPTNTIERYVYAANLKNGKIQQLLDSKGVHYASFNKSFKYFVDVYSSHSQKMARKYSMYNTQGKLINELLSDDNPLRNFDIGTTKIVKLKADDGTDLFAHIILPSDFDSTKKYPAILYVYGGPHAQMVEDTWLAGADMFLNFLAQQGYIVFSLDNRGSANRGRAFEQAIHRNLGTVEVDDQMKGIEYLKSLRYVDNQRIGVDGWSYGGFMTISLLLKHPETFKVACAGGPVIDWQYYEVMYGERYMDTPESNPEGYKNASLLNKIGNLNGKLLIIHGAQDNTVVWQHSLLFIQECIKQGKQVDYFVYPNHEHNVRGIQRMHLYEKITNYFNDYLK